MHYSLRQCRLDKALASEFQEKIKAQRQKCFLAEKDIEVGSEWEKQVHEAMRGSNKVVLLFTPNTVDRQWVLSEAGAARILEKRFYPAIAHVPAKRLPEAIAKFQAQTIETSDERKKFIDSLVKA